MIYDCFPFFNELELLELRLHELAPVVDRFVIVEATRTHASQPKPLYFEENKERFREFLPKIIHVVLSDFPETPPSRSFMDAYQRDAVARGLEGCRPDDVIILSDLDEIVRPQAILDHKDKPGIKSFRQRLYYYFFNCVCVGAVWDMPKMAFYRDLKSPQWLREYPTPVAPTKYGRSLAKLGHRIKQAVGAKDIHIEDGGWHFSFLGGIDRIREKIKAFAHENFDREEFLDPNNLLRAIESGEDLFGRKDMKFEFVPLDSSFPRYLVEHQERFRTLIRQTAKDAVAV